MQFMLSHVAPSLESDKAQLQPGDESDVKIRLHRYTRFPPRKARPRTKLPATKLLSVTMVRLDFLLKKEFLSTKDHDEHIALSVSGLPLSVFSRCMLGYRLHGKLHTQLSLYARVFLRRSGKPQIASPVCLHIAAQTSLVCDGRRMGLTDQSYKCKPAWKGSKYKVQTSSLREEGSPTLN